MGKKLQITIIAVIVAALMGCSANIPTGDISVSVSGKVIFPVYDIDTPIVVGFVDMLGNNSLYPTHTTDTNGSYSIVNAQLTSGTYAIVITAVYLGIMVHNISSYTLNCDMIMTGHDVILHTH